MEIIKNIEKYGQKISKADPKSLCLEIIKIGIFLALLLPLLVTPSQFDQFQLAKIVAFRTIIEIVLLFYIWLAIKDPKYRPKWNLLEISIALFTAIFFLTSLAGIDFEKSFWGTTERTGGFFSFLHYWIFFIITSSIFKTSAEWKKLFTISVFAAALSSLYAIGQSTHFANLLEWIGSNNHIFYSLEQKKSLAFFFTTINETRPYGTIGNAALFGGYILLNIFLGIYLFLSEKERNKRILYAFLVILSIAGLILSLTRSVYLALGTGAVSILIVYALLLKNRKIKALAIATIIVLLFSANFIRSNKNSAMVQNNFILARLASISTADSSAQSRIRSWKSAWEAFKEKPLLGWGPENFDIASSQHFNPLIYLNSSSPIWNNRAHNIFFDVAIPMGLSGLLSFLGIFAVIYFSLIKNYSSIKKNPATFALIAVFPLVYFIYTFFLFDTFPTYLVLFLFLGFIGSFLNNNFSYPVKNKKIDFIINQTKEISASIIGKLPHAERIKNFLTKRSDAIYGLLVLSTAFTIYAGNIKPWIFENYFTAATDAFKENNASAPELYKKAMGQSTYFVRHESYKYLGKYVWETYGRDNFKGTADQEKTAADFEFFIFELKSAIQENPYDAELYLMLGKIYNLYYNFYPNPALLANADFILQWGMQYSPNNQIFIYEYGQTLFNKKDYSKAVQVFRKARDLNPDSVISSWYLGLAYANNANYPEAMENMEKAISMGYDYSSTEDTINLARIYIELKNYDKANSLFDKIIQGNANNIPAYKTMLDIYIKINDGKSAKKVAEKLILLDPSLAPEIKKIIDPLK